MENKKTFISPVCTIVNLDDADVLTVSVAKIDFGYGENDADTPII